jgi:hypothetical protein
MSSSANILILVGAAVVAIVGVAGYFLYTLI